MKIRMVSSTSKSLSCTGMVVWFKPDAVLQGTYGDGLKAYCNNGGMTSYVPCFPGIRCYSEHSMDAAYK